MITHTPDNKEIYYHTKGTGPELLFIHGGAGRSTFDSLIEVLSPQYSCTSFDRLGWERSTHLDRNTTVEEQVAAIKAVHNSITSAPVWVFGWSSGGNFALAYTVAHPDRVKGLILVEPALYGIYPPEMKPPEVERMAEAISLFEQGQPEKGWDGFIEAAFNYRRKPSAPPRTEEDLENIRSVGYDLPMVITWCPSEAELNQVAQPVLIFEGDQSPSVHRNICHLLDGQLSNSELVTLEGQSHMMHRSAPKLVAEKLTAFISECEPRENP
jgi:pimeloyl-ACP methyl ester carboxylesterase